jgi:hypothetical protein
MLSHDRSAGDTASKGVLIMKRWLVIAGAFACALVANGADAKQSGPLARSGEAVGQIRTNPSFDTSGFANGRAPAAAVGGAIDVVAGTTFVGRDPDRHIRFQILRDSSRY